MKKKHVIDYLNIAIEFYEENTEEDNNISSMWIELLESYEDESYDKGIYLMLMQDAIMFSRSI